VPPDIGADFGWSARFECAWRFGTASVPALGLIQKGRVYAGHGGLAEGAGWWPVGCVC
jgi:hypothetical protein